MSIHRPSTRRRIARALLGAIAITAAPALLSGAVATSSDAAPPPAAASSSPDATVRAAHLSPSMPAADIYVSSYSGAESLWIDDATYGDVSPYKLLPPGAYTFSVRRHGAAMSAAPLRSWTLTAKAGDAYTAAVVGSGASARGVVLADNLTPPPAGSANVRLIQASSRAGTAQVTAVNGPVIAQNAAFGTTTGYAAVNAGTWPISATGHGRTTTGFVSLRAGDVMSILLLDAPNGGVRLTSTVDAAGAAMTAAPKRAIDAGGGGTATRVVNRPSARLGREGLLVVLAAGALGVAGLLSSYRRRTRSTASVQNTR